MRVCMLLLGLSLSGCSFIYDVDGLETDEAGLTDATRPQTDAEADAELDGRLEIADTRVPDEGPDPCPPALPDPDTELEYTATPDGQAHLSFSTTECDADFVLKDLRAGTWVEVSRSAARDGTFELPVTPLFVRRGRQFQVCPVASPDECTPMFPREIPATLWQVMHLGDRPNVQVSNPAVGVDNRGHVYYIGLNGDGKHQIFRWEEGGPSGRDITPEDITDVHSNELLVSDNGDFVAGRGNAGWFVFTPFGSSQGLPSSMRLHDLRAPRTDLLLAGVNGNDLHLYEGSAADFLAGTANSTAGGPTAHPTDIGAGSQPVATFSPPNGPVGLVHLDGSQRVTALSGSCSQVQGRVFVNEDASSPKMAFLAQCGGEAGLAIIRNGMAPSLLDLPASVSRATAVHAADADLRHFFVDTNGVAMVWRDGPMFEYGRVGGFFDDEVADMNHGAISMRGEWAVFSTHLGTETYVYRVRLSPPEL